MHVHEASLLHGFHLGPVGDHSHRVACKLAGLFEHGTERATQRSGPVVGDGPIITEVGGFRLDGLEIRARLENTVRLLVQVNPAPDRPEEVPNMDIINAGGVPGPVLGTVVDFKGQVRRDPCGLNRGEIRADDRNVRVLVGKVTAKSRG